MIEICEKNKRNTNCWFRFIKTISQKIWHHADTYLPQSKVHEVWYKTRKTTIIMGFVGLSKENSYSKCVILVNSLPNQSIFTKLKKKTNRKTFPFFFLTFTIFPCLLWLRFCFGVYLWKYAAWIRTRFYSR